MMGLREIRLLPFDCDFLRSIGKLQMYEVSVPLAGIWLPLSHNVNPFDLAVTFDRTQESIRAD